MSEYNPPSFRTHAGRQTWSFIAIMGASFVFTTFAAVAVWLVSRNELYSLILGLAAHAQLLIVMTAFAFKLGRRVHVSVGKDGVTLSDQDLSKLERLHESADAAQEAVTQTNELAQDFNPETER